MWLPWKRIDRVDCRLCLARNWDEFLSLEARAWGAWIQSIREAIGERIVFSWLSLHSQLSFLSRPSSLSSTIPPTVFETKRRSHVGTPHTSDRQVNLRSCNEEQAIVCVRWPAQELISSLITVTFSRDVWWAGTLSPPSRSEVVEAEQMLVHIMKEAVVMTYCYSCTKGCKVYLKWKLGRKSWHFISAFVWRPHRRRLGSLRLDWGHIHDAWGWGWCGLLASQWFRLMLICRRNQLPSSASRRGLLCAVRLGVPTGWGFRDSPSRNIGMGTRWDQLSLDSLFYHYLTYGFCQRTYGTRDPDPGEWSFPAGIHPMVFVLPHSIEMGSSSQAQSRETIHYSKYSILERPDPGVKAPNRMENPHHIPLRIPNWGGDRTGRSFEIPMLVLGSLVLLLGNLFPTKTILYTFS